MNKQYPQVEPEPAEVILMRRFPDLVFSKQRAERAYLTIFRTGEACEHGHTNYRSTRNGACVQCR